MSRAAANAGNEVIVVPPKSNVYTVLVIAAVIAEVLALVAIAMRHNALFPDGVQPHYLFF